MPGNDLGDRVHNFFAQDNLLQGQHHSQVVEGNWPVLNSNFWVGNQGQVDQLSSNSKNYTSQNSDVGRGETGYSLHGTNGSNLTQSNLRPDFAKNQSLNEQLNLNGFMYPNQFHQTRQNEANFLGMDTGSDNLHYIPPRGLLAAEVPQGDGTGHLTKVSDGAEASISPVGFDLFGGQHQMNHQQSSTTESLLHQHSGVNNLQQLQQQLMIRKLQEFRMQQQHNSQLDLRQQYLSGQAPSFVKHSSGGQSTLVNGAANSDTSLLPWTVGVGTNWLNQGSSSMQGSPSGLGFTPNLGQAQGVVDLVPQQVDQSLYGVPVSNSRGLNINHHSQMVTSRPSTPQSISSNFLQGNQPNLLSEQVGVQREFPMSRHKFQNDMFGNSSKQSQNLESENMGGLQQANFVSRNAPEKSTGQVVLPHNEVSLDPTEEKILFGSDDNIWAAFGKVPNVTGEAGNIFDNDGSNGLPSIQSGSWSALMQSAVAETSSSDMVPQEEWSGLTFQKKNGPSWSQPPRFRHNSFKKEKPLRDGSKRSFIPSDDVPNNVMTSSQHRQKFQNEPGQRLQTEVPRMFFQSSGEGDKWTNPGPLQTSIAEVSQYRDVSHPLQSERNAKTIGFPGQTATTISNGWNPLAAVPPEGDSVMNSHDGQNLQQNSKNSRVGVTRGEVFHGSSSWKSNSVPSSAMEFGNLKSRVSNLQGNQGILNVKDTTLVDNSRNVGISNETTRFQNNYSANQWAKVHHSARSQGGESLGRLLNHANDPNRALESVFGHGKDEAARLELENHDIKENSNDSLHSNLSQHSFGGFREGGVPEATDSRPVSAGKQKLANQLSRKVSAPRKFQYHPMGNVDEDVESTYDLKHPSHVQTLPQKNVHIGQPKLFGQATRDSVLIEKGQSSEFQRDFKCPDEEMSRRDLSGHAPNRHFPDSQSIETLNNAALSSQNMLELFNKAEHSKNHGATMQLSSAEPSAQLPVVSQLPVVKKYDELGNLQHSQPYVSQGFGLQLGPPSQGLQIPDQPSSSQSGQGKFNSSCSTNAAESLPSAEETHPEFKLNISKILERGGNEDSRYKTPGNITSSFSSGIPYSRSNDQSQQMRRASGQMPLNQQIDSSGNASYSAQRPAEALLPDASQSFQEDNHASFGAISQQVGASDVQERVPTATTAARDSQQTSHHFAIPGLSQQGSSIHMLHNMGTKVPMLKPNISAKNQQISPQVLEFPQSTIVESSAPLNDHVNSLGGDGEEQRLRVSAGQQVSSLNTEAVPEVKRPSFLKNHLDDSPSTSMRKDIEAFGRSLKPNSFAHQNLSLLDQIQASKDAEVDSSNRVSKRMKGLDDVMDAYHAATKAGQQHDNVLGDLSGSGRAAGMSQGNPTQDGNAASQDDLALNQGISDKNSYIFGVDPRVSPQMAPSWFNQYGSVKNGQVLQLQDENKVIPIRHGEQTLTHGKCSTDIHMDISEEKTANAPVDTCQKNNHQNLTSSSVASGSVSSLKSLQLNITGQNMGILRTKKRKSAILDLHPWHMESSEVSQDHVQSMTESDWDKASNCLTDKVDYDAELIEDGSLVYRCKRRLILTTYLMRKLFRSAPAAVLSADASTSHEFLVYAVSRVALGDACSTGYHLGRLDVPCDGMDLHPPKGKLSVRNGVRCCAEGAEELLDRARKLENDFLRLDKSASILDLRLECQDLEKFSVINRFARFHGRGQSDHAETSSTNVTAASQRPMPQRYVTALPLPRNIPDGVECLSL